VHQTINDSEEEDMNENMTSEGANMTMSVESDEPAGENRKSMGNSGIGMSNQKDSRNMSGVKPASYSMPAKRF